MPGPRPVHKSRVAAVGFGRRCREREEKLAAMLRAEETVTNIRLPAAASSNLIYSDPVTEGKGVRILAPSPAPLHL